ncbi:outer membrane protein assembly factor BamB family protein [Paenibacillus psychroresistens]|nr:PQQ-binding-like beta-propeller repeat protein [Paenibacillus psychroresistens]
MLKLLSLLIVFTLVILTGCEAKQTDLLPLATPMPTSGKLAPELIITASASIANLNSKIDDIEIASEALQRKISFNVYLPPGYDAGKQYPVLYSMYGYGGTRNYIFGSMGLDQVTDRLIKAGSINPLIIVSPDYGNSFGVNTKPGQGVNPGSVDEGSYEDYLIKELIPYVDSHYSTAPAKESRYIGGFSMGGYAALFLGFSHPELFSKIGGHSASIWDYSVNDEYAGQRDWLYPTEALRNLRDPFRLADTRSLGSVQVYLDAGESDGLAVVDEKLYNLLKAKQIPAEWHTSPGGHATSYWSSHFEDYLNFYSGKTKIPATHQEIWKFQTDGRISSTPLVYNDSLIFGSDDHKLYSVNESSGQAQWSFEADSSIRSNPQSSGDLIIFQSNAGTVYAVNATSGKRKWSFATTVQQGEQDQWDYYDSSASIDKDTVYIGSADHNVYALNALSGTEIWHYKASGAVKSTPVYDDNSVYFGDWEGSLYALDKKTGVKQWTFATEPNGRHKAIQSTPALHDGVIYLAGRNFKLYAILASSGKQLWELTTPAWVASPIYVNGVIYVGNSNGNFVEAVDAKSGISIWKFFTKGNVLSAPLFDKDQLIFGSGYAYEGTQNEDYLYTIDAASGQLTWKISTDKIHSAAAINHDVIYYTGFDQALHAIK